MDIKKIVLLAFCSLLISFSVFADDQNPKTASTSYYSDGFLDDVKNNTKDEDLKLSILQTFKKHTSIGYDSAKVFLMGKFYLISENNHYAVKDVYCNREIPEDEFPADKKPGPNRVPANEIINTEHTWPQSRFNKSQNIGMQKADLHHLFPTDSLSNNVRGNFKFGEVQNEMNSLKCNGPRFGTPSYSSERVFEPPTNHKGNVARALFYFAIKYKLVIDKNEEATLRKWTAEDPVDDEEMLRNDEIEKVQRSRNPFIDFPELVHRISDF